MLNLTETDRLSAILDSEILAATAILEATESATGALKEGDLGALETAGALRARHLRHLQDLHREAQELLGKTDAPEQVQPRLTKLRGIFESIARCDECAREIGTSSLAALRTELRSLNAGRRVLEGYRGPKASLPRFSDRRS